MKTQGWIKLHRKLLENTIFTSEKGLKVWIWCLLKANHQDQDVFNGRQKVHITTGQFIMGRNTAKEELKMAVGTIWFWLDQLEKDKYVERKSTNKYTVVTILNYSQYQETERRLNADRTQIVQQIEPNNNDKNVENDKNDKNNNILATKVANLNLYIDKFKGVNPTYERLLGNKSQRASLERLIIQFGEERMNNLLTQLPEIMRKPYAPQISTPIELENKMGKLIQFLNQEKLKIQSKGVTKL